MAFVTPLLSGLGIGGATAGAGLGIGTVLQGAAAVASLIGAFKPNTPPVPDYKDVSIPTPQELGTTLTSEQALAQQEAEQLRNKRRMMAADLDSRIAVSTSTTRFADNTLQPASVTKATLLGG